LQLNRKKKPSSEVKCYLFNVVVSQNKPYCLINIIDRGCFADRYFVSIRCSGQLLKVELAVAYVAC
jgi:hypothetical protein